MKFVSSLIKGLIYDLPFLIEVEYSRKVKITLLFFYVKLSFGLFFSKKIKRLTHENILGYKIFFFDYGTLHFLFREIFIRGTYFVDSVDNNIEIIDCGANIGMATIYFKWLFPHSKITSFEPDPQTFKLLKKNIDSNNLKDITLVNAALYKTKGKIKFYIDKKNPGWLTMSLLKARLPRNEIWVDSVALSHYMNRKIHIIKIDVEGVEQEVVSEIFRNSLKNINILIVEYHHNILSSKEKLSTFLLMLEKNSFTYNLSALNNPGENTQYQDISVYAQK